MKPSLRLILFVVLTRCLISSISAVPGELHRRTSDSCTQYFDIKRGHVVHVSNSEAIGGRLLNSSRGLAPSDCMKLCCETEHCTTASFQQKDDWNCYLFDCGSPDDFRCEIIGFSQYDTAILTVLRRDLPKPIPLVLPPTESACGSRQFQCRTSKECIPLYDRCNEVYECIDRSDEERCDEFRQEQHRLANLERENEQRRHQLEDSVRNRGSLEDSNVWDRGRNRVADSDRLLPAIHFQQSTERSIWNFQNQPVKLPIQATDTAHILETSTVKLSPAVTMRKDVVTSPTATSSVQVSTVPSDAHTDKPHNPPMPSWIDFSDPSHFVVSVVLLMAFAFCGAVTVFVVMRWLCCRKDRVTKYRIVDPDAEDFLLTHDYS